MKHAMKQAGKVALGPVIRFFDRRFEVLGARVDQQVIHADQEVARSVGNLNAALAEVRQVTNELHSDAAAVRELGLLALHASSAGKPAPAASVGDPLADLDQATADLVNWVISPIGMAGEALAWINHGASVSFGAGRAWIDNLNERIIELPWAHAKAATLPRGATVLDIGSTEGLLAMELATSGLHVYALDPRPYPLQHPNLTAVPGTTEDWEGPAQPLDAVFAISAVEHFGLGHYVEAAERDDLDRVAVECFGRWLKPGAPLFLTVPFGTWQVNHLERVYDAAHLEALVAGWEVLEREVYARRSNTVWERLDPESYGEPWFGGAGVALLVLRQPS